MNTEEEVWKEIPSFPTYAASNLGRIKNIKRNTILKQSLVDVNREYQRVSISYLNKEYTKKVSRMVWSAFNDGECPETINHIDGNPRNNNINNLECISIKDNCSKKHIYRKVKNKYNLDDNKKREILTAYQNKTKSVWKLSIEYSIPPNYLYTTFKRGSWNHLCWNNDTNNIKN
jgi:Mg/Co/Ni transporter MgtE